MREHFLQDEDGFTTLGMVVSLLLVLSLIFSSAQVYRVNSLSARIQDVADAAALAAENEVAEFMIAVRVCDAVSLSLSLASALSTGLGVAALCVPGIAEVGDGLINAGRTLANSRDAFAEKAKAGLNAAQRALPFIAATKAALVARSNNTAGGCDTNYYALALLCPFEGQEIEIETARTDEAFDQIDGTKEELERSAAQAEEEAQAAYEAKYAGYMADCGDDPNYCLYERAGWLGGLEGSDNPYYASADTWSFSVALQRTRSYYESRVWNEAPLNDTVEEQARSALRRNYYRFRSAQLEQAYVHETDDSFQAWFPRAPRNTTEMRETSLYTERAYPITEHDGEITIHAWSGCPGAAGWASNASLAESEANGYGECPYCQFTAASLGKVAAASSSIENGFEYHYNRVADAAEEYQVAREKADERASETKSIVSSLLEACKDICEQGKNARIDAVPPGKDGALVLAVDTAQSTPGFGFENTFVASGQTLGIRAAVSASTLVVDESEDGATLLNSLLDGVRARVEGEFSVSQLALDCWSGLLSAYSSGQEAITESLETALDGIPLFSASGLGTWAANAFKETMQEFGLQPAQLQALRPVVVNTLRVAEQSDDAVATRFLSLRNSLAEGVAQVDSVLAWARECESTAGQSVLTSGGTLDIVQLAPFGDDGPSVPLVLVLPPVVQGFVENCAATIAAGINSVAQTIQGLRRWS